MELKKDSNAVAIDMLLIVHSEKRRAAQATHLDPQADPGALLQNRGGNTRVTRVLRIPGHLGHQAPGSAPRGAPKQHPLPQQGQSKPLLDRCLGPGTTAPAFLGNAQSTGCPRPVFSCYSLKGAKHLEKCSSGRSQGLRLITCNKGLVPRQHAAQHKAPGTPEDPCIESDFEIM